MIKATYEIALAAAQDAANRQMRQAGRLEWNEDDWNLAAQTVQTLRGESNED